VNAPGGMRAGTGIAFSIPLARRGSIIKRTRASTGG